MTAHAGAYWPSTTKPAGLTDVFAFAIGVAMLLIYSQAWEFPFAADANQASSSGLIRALFFPAYAAGVALLALAPVSTGRALVRQPFLVLIVLIAASSVLWSVSPEQTQRRIFALALTTLSGVVLGARFSWAQLASVAATAFGFLAIVSLIAGLFFPHVGRMSTIFVGAWRGLWLEKNSFGGMMALSAVCATAAAFLNPQRAGRWWTLAALSVSLVALSTSKTSLVALILGAMGLGLVLLARRGPAGGVAAAWLAVVGLAVLACVVAFASDWLLALLGKDATLTGRTPIWSAVLRQIGERPWQGYGYAAIWDETDRWGPLAWITKDAGFQPDHSHNSWLEQWLALGVPGLAAWAGLYLQTLAANVVALFRHRGAFLALPFFVVYSMMTLTESIAVTYNDLRWVLFVAFAARLAMPDADHSAATATRPASRPVSPLPPR